MKKKHFSTKLLITSLEIAGSVLLAFLCISIVFNFSSIKKKTLMKQQLAAETETIQLDNYLSNMIFVSLDILCRDDFIDAAKMLFYQSSDKTDEVVLQENFQVLKNTLLSYSLNQTAYQVVFFNTKGYFVTNYGNGFDYRYGYKIEDHTIAGLRWKDEVIALKGAELILPLRKDEFFGGNSDVISIARTVRDPGKAIGFLVVQTDIENMQYIFDAIDENYEVCVLDSNNNEIYSSRELLGGELDYYGQIKDIDEKDIVKNPVLNRLELVSYSTSTENGWTVYVVAPLKYIISELLLDIQPLLWSTIILLFIIFLFYLKTAKQFARPMAALAKQMETLTLDSIDQETNYMIQNDYQEIEDLSRAFSTMRIRLNDMINKEIMYQTLQLEERFKTLQSQINPHFLYNTLGVIGVMGVENGNENVCDACEALADLLKYSISNPKQYATFKQEFGNVQCYLDLLKIRYEHKLNFTIALEEKLEEIAIPKLTMQPLIENIIQYGFGEEHKCINIELTGKIIENHWIVRIEDDGIGFSEEAIHRIETRLREYTQQNQVIANEHETAHGMGIVNTFARLRIFFHNTIEYEFGNRETGGAYLQLSSNLEV